MKTKKITNSEISVFLKERVRLGEVVKISDKRYCSIDLIAEGLKENFPNFAIRLTDVNTNPINYL